MISKTVLRWLTLVVLMSLCFGVMVPAASAADTEITSCPFTITMPGAYFLKKNLTATGTDCIVVETSNVAIDMRGHTITGNGGAFMQRGITDRAFFAESVAISNGKIKNFFFGIAFSGELITLERIDASNNKVGGIFINGCCNSITDVKANTNGNDGVRVIGCCNVFNKIQANDNTGNPGGEGIEEEGCCNTANQITANHNGDDGMEWKGCCTGVSNSQANDNKGNGIHMEDDDESVANVKTNGNALAGIDITDSDNQLTNATANDNGADGIEFGGSTEEVADSVANNNKIVGIDLGNGTFNTATDVTTNHNATGVALKFPCNAVNVRAHNNSSHNLLETGGTCTNLLNSAP